MKASRLEPNMNLSPTAPSSDARRESTLAVDPSDRFLPIDAQRPKSRLMPVVIGLVVAASIVGGVVWWQRGDETMVSLPTPTEMPTGTSTGTFPGTSPGTSPGTFPGTSTAAPSVTPTAANGPEAIGAPAISAENKLPVAPAPQTPVQQAATPTDKAVVKPEKSTSVVPEKASEKKPAEKKAIVASEKKPNPAVAQATSQSKPIVKKATKDDGDKSFSTLLNSLTNEAPQQESAPVTQEAGNEQPVIQQPAVEQPAIEQPALSQPSDQTGTGAPLPVTTAPSTPGSQLFTP